MNVELHPHALARLPERGATATEVIETVTHGTPEPAKLGRTRFVLTHAFDGIWRGRHRDHKVVEALAVFENGRWLVITVIVKFHAEGGAMKVTYDPRYNVAYIALRDDPQAVETVALSDAVNIDFGPDGAVYGIELLDANEQLRAAHGGRILVVNGAASSEAAIPVITATVRPVLRSLGIAASGERGLSVRMGDESPEPPAWR